MKRETAIELLEESKKYLGLEITGKEWDESLNKYVEKTYKFIDTAKFEFKIQEETPSITLYAKLSDGNNTQIESLSKIVEYFKSIEKN